MNSSIQDGQLYQYRFGNAEFDEAAMILKVDGQEVALEPKPLMLLRFFLNHIDEVVTREEILENVWPGSHNIENVVPNAVNKIRTALGSTANQLKTRKAVGYMMTGPVERTALAQRMRTSAHAFAVGGHVPHRNNFVFDSQLSDAPGREAWRARHVKSGEHRIYKFASDAHGLNALKREVTISRILAGKKASNAAVTVLDWNFETPEFFVEFQDGGASLAEWATPDAEGASPLAALDRNARIGLAAQVVRAVMIAHDAGVLHRDIKPSNILVGNPGSGDVAQRFDVRLIDFGSGGVRDTADLDSLKITPHGLEGHDNAGGMQATAYYVAPEVLAGQPATALSDVYALGIVLYQIIAGDLALPLPANWRENVPEELLQADIEAATHADPTRRLGSAAELLKNLETLDERIARRDENRARDQELAAARALAERRRERQPFVIVAGLALIVGAVASLFFAVGARRAQEIAEQNERQATTALTFLTETLASANPRAPGIGPEPTIAEAVDNAAAKLSETFADDPQSREKIMETLIEVYNGLFNFKQSTRLLEELRTLQRELYGADSPTARVTGFRLALALSRASDTEAATALLEELTALEETMTEKSLEVDFARHLATSMVNLFNFNFPAVRESASASIAAYEQSGYDDIPTLFQAKMNLGQALSRLGEHDEAIAVLEEILGPPYADSDEIPEFLKLRHQRILASSYQFAGRFVEAERMLRSTRSALVDLYGEDHPQMSEYYAILGMTLNSQERNDEAAEAISQGRKIACAARGDKNIACITAFMNEARMVKLAGKEEEALALFDTARSRLLEIMSADTPFVQWVDFERVDSLTHLRRADEANDILPGLKQEILQTTNPQNDWAASLETSSVRIKAQLTGAQEDLDAMFAVIERIRTDEGDMWMVERLMREFEANKASAQQDETLDAE